jgi:hypothetical protein
MTAWVSRCSEPAYAVADAWKPPDALALPADMCERIRATAAATEPSASGSGTYYFEPAIDPADDTAIVYRFAEANGLWWDLDVDRWILRVKRYRPGTAHRPTKTSTRAPPGGSSLGSCSCPTRTSTTGGALVMRFANHAVSMPTAPGSLVAFPGWTVHEVEPITRGERWSL